MRRKALPTFYMVEIFDRAGAAARRGGAWEPTILLDYQERGEREIQEAALSFF